jgi:MscS family membrane protein
LAVKKRKTANHPLVALRLQGKTFTIGSKRRAGMSFKDINLGGIEIMDMLFAFGIILLTLTLRMVLNRYIFKKIMKLAEKTSHDYDDLLLEAILPPVSAGVLATGFYYALRQLPFQPENWNWQETLSQSYRIALSLVAVWGVFRLADFVAKLISRMISRSDPDMAQQFAPLIRQALRWTVAIIGAILIVQNLGYSVGSLLAGVGIGGLAIALAAQETLANFFGTIVMFTDRPFKVGHWIKFADGEGTIEEIGFRSTRIRTFANSLIVVPNKLLTGGSVENWSAMNKRRVKAYIGLTYDSPPERVEELVKRVRLMLEGDSDVRQDFMLVNFTDFNAYSLDVLVYYFTVTTVWAEYLAVRQKINLEIMKIVHELELQFAFPSQTLYLGDEEFKRTIAK